MKTQSSRGHNKEEGDTHLRRVRCRCGMRRPRGWWSATPATARSPPPPPSSWHTCWGCPLLPGRPPLPIHRADLNGRQGGHLSSTAITLTRSMRRQQTHCAVIDSAVAQTRVPCDVGRLSEEPTSPGLVWADQAGRVRRVEDLARALPKLVDLHLQRSLLMLAGQPAGLHSPVGCMMEEIVGLHRCFSLLLIPARHCHRMTRHQKRYLQHPSML